MSESVPGDSHRTSLPAEIFARLRAPISFRVEFFVHARSCAANNCRTAHKTDSRTRLPSRASESEFLFQDFVDRLRARLAAGRLHDLSDEPADRLRVGFGAVSYTHLRAH